MRQKLNSIESVMKRAFILSAILLSFSSFSQINMTQLGYLDIATMHSCELNDIWGYTDEVGNEYALVGTTKGVSVVDVTDPTTPVEIAWIPGMSSIWRDIKTYGDYAYVTTEASEGLLIIDLSPLPAVTTLPTSYYYGPSTDQWQSAHNLYQADGYVYIAGANRGNGGIIILDVATDPLNPIEVGTFDQWYAHDVYVRNDTGFFSHVNEGFFTIVDLTDKTNVTLTEIYGSLTTPNNFTHNAWLSTDGLSLFTTDEVSNGWIASYDISDPTNPILQDQIQSSPGNNIIPHNAHVKGNYLITSYYTDGVVVHDVSDPANIVEVGNFDTSPAYNGGTFNGCWGVYPFFASDNIIASDIEMGLYVLGLSPTLTSYLQGNITSAGTGLPINNALIEILGTAVSDNSDVLGDYSIGTVLEGLMDVRYSAPGYYADTFAIDFVNGQIVTQNVALVQIPLFTATITVIDAVTSAPIENAFVRIDHTSQSFEGMTDVNGEVTIDLFYEDNYDITGGIWGYVNNCFNGQSLTIANNTLTIPLTEGIYDDFTFDFGWTTSSSATSGDWVRDVPIGTQSAGQEANPYDDFDSDCSTLCYVTGNGGGAVGNDDIDGGSVTLNSPIFDLSAYSKPVVSFAYWFFNGFGSGFPNDSLAIYITNGTSTVQIESYGLLDITIGGWVDKSYLVEDYLTPTSTMQLIFVASDFPGGHVVEAGVDYFRAGEFGEVSIEESAEQNISIYPNPASTELVITGFNSGLIEIYDLSGRIVISTSATGTLDISALDRGIYMVVLKDLEGNTLKVQKQEVR